MLNVSKYLPFYAKGAKPRFIEGDPFVTVIPLPPETTARTEISGSEITRVKTRVKAGVKTGVKKEAMVALIAEDPSITREALAEKLSLTVKGVDWHLARMKASGRLRRIGPDKGGHWEVVR